jgi:hypothetical protein
MKSGPSVNMSNFKIIKGISIKSGTGRPRSMLFSEYNSDAYNHVKLNINLNHVYRLCLKRQN